MSRNIYSLRNSIFYYASRNSTLKYLEKNSCVSIYPHIAMQDSYYVNGRIWNTEDLEKDYFLEPGIKFKKDLKIDYIPYLYRGFLDHTKVEKGDKYPYFFNLKSREKIDLISIIDTFEIMRISEDIYNEDFIKKIEK